MISDEVIKSPCILICVLDSDDICQGCYRSAQEITDWSTLSTDDRKNVLVTVKGRYQQLNTHLLL